jgi:hypothetical protein
MNMVMRGVVMVNGNPLQRFPEILLNGAHRCLRKRLQVYPVSVFGTQHNPKEASVTFALPPGYCGGNAYRIAFCVKA